MCYFNANWYWGTLFLLKGLLTNDVSLTFGTSNPLPLSAFWPMYSTKITQPPLLHQILGNPLPPPLCWHHLWMVPNVLIIAETDSALESAPEYVLEYVMGLQRFRFRNRLFPPRVGTSNWAGSIAGIGSKSGVSSRVCAILALITTQNYFFFNVSN